MYQKFSLVHFRLSYAFSALTLWLGSRNGIRSVKKLNGEVLTCLFVCSEVKMICIWYSWCYCHPVVSLAPV